jgi:hypothetical protein
MKADIFSWLLLPIERGFDFGAGYSISAFDADFKPITAAIVGAIARGYSALQDRWCENDPA